MGDFGQSVTKASRGGGRVADFFKPTKSHFDIFESEFWIFPMNLVALAEDFQNQIFFIAQGNYPEF